MQQNSECADIVEISKPNKRSQWTGYSAQNNGFEHKNGKKQNREKITYMCGYTDNIRKQLRSTIRILCFGWFGVVLCCVPEQCAASTRDALMFFFLLRDGRRCIEHFSGQCDALEIFSVVRITRMRTTIRQGRHTCVVRAACALSRLSHKIFFIRFLPHSLARENI